MRTVVSEQTIINYEKHKKHRNYEYSFVLPALIIVSVLFITPILFTVIASFTNFELGDTFKNTSFIGLDNYTRLIDGTQSNFGYSIYISILFAVLGTALEVIIGIICAVIINREFKLKGLVIACIVLPMAMTPSIAAQMWKLMFNATFGVINFVLNALIGKTIVWLDADHAFLSCLIATVWQFTSQVTLMMYAGLRSLPDSPYESAKIDGANKLQIFFRITIPMMRNLILLCVLLRTVDMLKTFDIPYTLTQGGPGSATKFLSLLVYDTGIGNTNFVGRASAMAVILIFIVCLFCIILFRVQNKYKNN